MCIIYVQLGLPSELWLWHMDLYKGVWVLCDQMDNGSKHVLVIWFQFLVVNKTPPKVDFSILGVLFVNMA